MATIEGTANVGAKSAGPEAPTLFLRKATGLVRGWSVRDAMVYACLSTNIITLGIYEFSFTSPFPKGQLLTGVLISGVWVTFLVIAYAGLIVTIPRAGGDYVWQSRILGGPVGFVFSATGWWFILWLWAPIYGAILNVELFQPFFYTIGAKGAAAYFGTHNGEFTICIITIVIAGILVSLGMSVYARFQKWCFAGGMIGFLTVVILLLAFSHSSFVSSVDSQALKYFGVHHAYQATQKVGASLGPVAPVGFGLNSFGASMLLVPLLMFYLLWPNWGSTLYGEIRGASDFKRVFTGMAGGLWLTVGLSVIFLLLVDKTIGWSFYNNANAASFNLKGVIPIWPYPIMMAGWLVHNEAFQVALILVMSLWFFGWVGTLFLSSTRVIFAAAFDRVLPDSAATVSEKRKVPMASLLLMLLPAVGLSVLYSYWSKFTTYTLDATLVIAVTYLVSAFSVVILPWRKPDLWAASPASRFKVLGVPIVPVAGAVTMALLIFNLVEWLKNPSYYVNSHDSLIFMGILYALAVVVYAVARLIRKRQGIDLGLINKEIPVE